MAAASSGEQAMGTGTPTPGELGDLMGPHAGKLEKKSRKRDTWKVVLVLVRVSLWWIESKDGQDYPKETGAWRKGRHIALVRGKTEIQHTEGELAFVVVHGDERQKFRVVVEGDDPQGVRARKVAARWVGTLTRRVMTWEDLLEGKGPQKQEPLDRIEDGGEMPGPLSKSHVETARAVVKVTGAAAAFLKEVLGSLPVAGAALSLLGFVLEVVHRHKDDAENFQSAESELIEVAAKTMGAIRRAAKCKEQHYMKSLAGILTVVESCAGNLEQFENRSTMVKAVDALLKRKRGPVAVLEMVRQCKDELCRAQIDHADEVAGNIKEIVAEAAQQLKILRSDVQEFKSCQGGKDRSMPVPQACIPMSPDAIGLDNQLSILRSMLLSDGDQYVALLGLGGIGKTTLAQKLVNDPQVEARYPKRAFVVISQDPNITQCQKRIFQDLMRSTHQLEITSSEDGLLQLKALLKSEEFLLVLDDVWYRNHAKYFMVASQQNSRILVTSRHEEVAKCMGATRKCHHMDGLDDKESMDLFCLHAFAGEQPSSWQRPYVQDIVKECKGLPLALAVMGGEAKSYSRKGGETSGPTLEEREKWRNAAESMKQGEVARDVFDRVFIWSYRNLAAPNRAALLFIAMLPEDHEVLPSDLFDLLCSDRVCNDVEAARRVVQELVEKSLIIRVGENQSHIPDFQQHNPTERRNSIRYRMHDVVRDSALWVIQYNTHDVVGDNAMTAAELPLSERDKLVSSQLPEPGCQHQVLSLVHFSTTQNITEDQQEYLQDLEMPSLRVLVMRNASVSRVPEPMLVTKLVALDLTLSGILKLPPQISVLKCARLLRLDYCEMLECLPNGVGELEELSVLSLRGCRSLYSVPVSVWQLSRLTKLLAPCCGFVHFLPTKGAYLPKLKVLDLSRCFGLKRLGQSIGELTSLTALNLGGCWQLGSLPVVVGQLTRLEVLILHGCHSLSEIPISVGRLDKLTELDAQGCSNLSRLPGTIGDGCLGLRRLRLQGNIAMDLPMFVTGLQKLEVLGITGFIPPAFEQQVRENSITLECSTTSEYEENNRQRGWTPLHWAAMKGLEEMALFHLKETTIDCQYKFGRTPLHLAASGGHAAVAEALLKHGASVDLADKNGKTPLIWAAYGGHEAAAEVLLKHGASANLADKNGDTAFALANREAHTAVAELLRKHGAAAGKDDDDHQESGQAPQAQCRGRAECED